MTHLWYVPVYYSDPIIIWPMHTFIPLHSVLQILQTFWEPQLPDHAAYSIAQEKYYGLQSNGFP